MVRLPPAASVWESALSLMAPTSPATGAATCKSPYVMTKWGVTQDEEAFPMMKH